MSTTESELSEEVIRGCASGDRKCQKIVYEQFYTRMYSVCLRYSNNKDEALDLLHEGYMKVFRKVETFKGESEFYPWIKRLFVNHCIDYTRSAYKRYISYVDEVVTDEAEEVPELPGEQTDAVVNQQAVFAAMNALRPDYRIILNLYAVENMSHAQIAQKLGIQESSSRSKLNRARNALKKTLKRNG